MIRMFLHILFSGWIVASTSGCGILFEPSRDNSIISNYSSLDKKSVTFRLAEYEYWGEGIFDIPLPDDPKKEGLLRQMAENPEVADWAFDKGKKFWDKADELVSEGRKRRVAEESSKPSSHPSSKKEDDQVSNKKSASSETGSCIREINKTESKDTHSRWLVYCNDGTYSPIYYWFSKERWTAGMGGFLSGDYATKEAAAKVVCGCE